MPEESPKFNLAAFAEILRLRNKQGQPYVLIGGQAVNFWAERYCKTETTLESYAPFTSRDIDFFGNKADVTFMSAQLGKSAVYPHWRAMTALAGTIPLVVGKEGSSIEVVRLVPGVKSELVEKSAFPAEFHGVVLRVIFPVQLLICKAHLARTIEQKGRQDVFHVKVMLLCVRAFLAESLSHVQTGEITARDWLNIVKDLLAFTESDLGQNVAKQYGIDWGKVLPELDLAQVTSQTIRTFYEKRVPLWRQRLKHVTV